MRSMILAAASVALCIEPAAAAEIVQYDSQSLGQGFSGFDSALGTLDSVTLDITLSKPRHWTIIVPDAAATEATFDWEVDGAWALYKASSAPGGQFIANVALVGSGTQTVALTPTTGNRAVNTFALWTSGFATLSLDPTWFIDTRTLFDGFDTGRGTGLDTSFSIDRPAMFSNSPSFGCNGELGCGSAAFKLTFNYTPGGVPEPETWALMILGFGAIGATLRSRSRRLAIA